MTHPCHTPCLSHNHGNILVTQLGSGDSQWLERQTHDQKVTGSRGSGRILLLGHQLSVLTLILVSVPSLCYHNSTYKILVILPKVQVTAKHTLSMWLSMKWCDMVHSCQPGLTHNETSLSHNYPAWHTMQHPCHTTTRSNTQIKLFHMAPAM